MSNVSALPAAVTPPSSLFVQFFFRFLQGRSSRPFPQIPFLSSSGLYRRCTLTTASLLAPRRKTNLMADQWRKSTSCFYRRCTAVYIGLTVPEKTSYDRMITAFVALQLTGAVGLLLIIATATIGRGVVRYSTWYSFCVSWIISCLSYSLLFLAGQQSARPPPFGLCVTQSALIYFAPVLYVYASGD